MPYRHTLSMRPPQKARPFSFLNYYCFGCTPKNAQKGMFFSLSRDGTARNCATAKESWGWLRVGVGNPRLVLAECMATCHKVTATRRHQGPTAGAVFQSRARFRATPPLLFYSHHAHMHYHITHRTGTRTHHHVCCCVFSMRPYRRASWRPPFVAA